MAPGRYTELFFLDEATAFSAGHRPCAECRRERYKQFTEKWLEANPLNLEKVLIKDIDRIVHEDRISRGQKVTYTTPMNVLPNGTMIEIDSDAYLIWHDKLLKWAF